MSIDPSALESYREFMGEEADVFIKDIVTSYQANAPELIASLKSALDEENHEAFVRAAHTLKSNSATIGAIALSQVAAALEERGKAGDMNALREEINRAKLELQDILKELKALYP
jgi:HPt (histidine-containing phosphotransfer) domain-containing protein